MPSVHMVAGGCKFVFVWKYQLAVEQDSTEWPCQRKISEFWDPAGPWGPKPQLSRFGTLSRKLAAKPSCAEANVSETERKRTCGACRHQVF